MKSKQLNIFSFPFLLLFVFFATGKTMGQGDQPMEKKELKTFKNAIRYNLTNPLIFGESYIFGYERLIGKNQSFSVNMGSFSFPKLASLDLDSIKEMQSSKTKSGFNICLDYRFYLAKFNRFNAPRGVYIGPYTYYANSKRTFNLNQYNGSYVNEFSTNFRMDVATLGVQLGYQFVFWNRLSLDMILIGPGASVYTLKAGIDTTLDPAAEEELFRKINEALAAKIPGYDKVIGPGDLKSSGTFRTTSLGYRYLIMIGFRF